MTGPTVAMEKFTFGEKKKKRGKNIIIYAQGAWWQRVSHNYSIHMFKTFQITKYSMLRMKVFENIRRLLDVKSNSFTHDEPEPPFYNLDKSICFFIISSVLELISSSGSFW